MKKKLPTFLAIRATETDWRNMERLKLLMSYARPSIRSNNTYIVSEALRMAVANLEREAAAVVADGMGQT